MSVVCSILVLYFVGNVGIYSKTDLKGNVMDESETMYLVNFQEDAKHNEYSGDYSHKLVSKKDCVVVR